MSVRAGSPRGILVHPSALYVGIRLQPEHDDVLQAVVTDVDEQPNGWRDPSSNDPRACSARSGFATTPGCVDQQPARCRSAGAPVVYQTSRTTRSASRTRRSLGRGSARAPQRRPARDSLVACDEREGGLRGGAGQDALPSRRRREADDIVSKVVPATAVVTFARQGVIAQKRIELNEPTTTVELPIEDGFMPERQGRRRSLREAAPAPGGEHAAAARAHERRSTCPSTSRARGWRCAPGPTQPLVEPGEDATFEVEVKRDGKPVAGAEVALIVVDEAVLALSGEVARRPARAVLSRGRRRDHADHDDARHDPGRGLRCVAGTRRASRCVGRRGTTEREARLRLGPRLGWSGNGDGLGSRGGRRRS